MKALVGEEGDLILDSEWDREPGKNFQDGGDMIVFAHPHQDCQQRCFECIAVSGCSCQRSR